MDHDDAFTECWHRDAPRVLAYARRHAVADDAADVVAETYAIAWRRWADVPDPPIGWLLVTARRVIQNRARSTRRHDSVAARIALLNQAISFASDTADAVVRRDEALRRLALLSDDQREALLLVTWDGLSADEAAAVLNLKAATFRKRVSRARELLDRDEPPPRGKPSPFPRHRPATVLTSQEMP